METLSGQDGRLTRRGTLHNDEYEIIVTFVGAGIAMLLYVRTYKDNN